MKPFKVVLISGIIMIAGMTGILKTLGFLQIQTNDALAIRIEGGLVPKAEIPVLSSKALKGSPEAAYTLASEYRFQLRLHSEAVYWEEIGAENGDLFAQLNLGYYMNGGFRGERNRHRGRFWLSKAAGHEGKDPLKDDAIKLLKEIEQTPMVRNHSGDDLLPDHGQPLLPDEESKEVRLDALAGSPGSAFRLYLFYEYVHRDVEESRYWLRIAAQNDDPVGQFEFGLLLAKDSDERNQQRSRFWIERAARNGNPGAAEYLKNFPGE
ncbi:MAG: tetratricopeptide repeat protein [Syntrophobacteraceae bacterium]